MKEETTKKRRAVKEPIEDGATLVNSPVEESVVSEEASVQETLRTLTDEERLVEVYYIVRGVEAEKKKFVASAEEKITQISEEVKKQSAGFDELIKVYSAEHADVLSRISAASTSKKAEQE